MAKTAGKQSGSQASDGNNDSQGGSNGSLQTGPSAPRPMRLKILYSLDELMPNCLARAKEVAQVRVIQLDTDTAIGLVDLRTCVLNITYSSPEILHHHGCDYSVYAFDYSEPDTPIVGLGLLSWVLSLPALNGTLPDPDAIPLSQATRIVTGRVQKNLIGLFAGGIKETLEVRMRLCRVPALKQAEYVNQMNQYSSMSKSMPAGLDVASWWTQSQIQNMGYPQQAYMSGQDPGRGYPSGPASGPPSSQPIPPGQPLGPPPSYPNQQPYPLSHPVPPYYGHPQYAPQESSTYIPPPPHPSSFSVPPNPAQPAPAAPTSTNTPIAERDESLTDSAQPAKKKQKVEKADKAGLPLRKRGPGRPRKQSENTLISSDPGVVPQFNRTTSEPINNRPTPLISLPHSKTSTSTSSSQDFQDHTTKNSMSQLQSAETLSETNGSTNIIATKPQAEMLSPAVSVPVVEGDTSFTPESPDSTLNPPTCAMTRESPYLSPSVEPANANTPANTDLDSLFIGSSPPISSEHRSGATPAGATSPFLPESPADNSSPDEDNRDLGEVLQEALSREQSPVNEDQLPPMRSALSLPTKPTVSFEADLSDNPTSALIKDEESLKNKERAIKPAPTSDAITQSEVLEEADAATAPAPKRRRRGGDDYQRCTTTKERIERKMKEKIKAGEMPNYCTHCGQIETPTWRKVKIPIEDAEEGEPTEREILLCNPCGLWHHNHGTMRPEQFWDHPENKPRPTRKPRRKKSTIPKPDGALAYSTDPANEKVAVQATQTVKIMNVVEVSEEEIRKKAADKPTYIDVGGMTDEEEDNLAASSPKNSSTLKARAITPPICSTKNEEWEQTVKAKARRIQSSPTLSRGSVADPICLLTPERSVNRVLFPGSKSSPARLAAQCSTIKNLSSRDSDDEPSEQVIDKENHPPQLADEGLDWEAELEKELLSAARSEHLTSVEEGEKTPVPSTPIKTPRTAHEFKTPIRKTPNKSLPGSIGKSPWRALFGSMTPSGRWANLGTPNKLLENPSLMMSPASGEIMLELLQEMNKTQPIQTSPSKGGDQQDDFNNSLFNDLDIDFTMTDHNFLGTSDQPMPSSPPPMFRLYDESNNPMQSSSSLWSDILPSSPSAIGTYSLDFLNGLGASKTIETSNTNPVEDTLDLQLNDDLVVDFSEFIAGVGSAAKSEELKNVGDQVVTGNVAVGTPTESTTSEEGK